MIFNKMFEITKEQQDITTLRNTPNIFWLIIFNKMFEITKATRYNNPAKYYKYSFVHDF